MLRRFTAVAFAIVLGSAVPAAAAPLTFYILGTFTEVPTGQQLIVGAAADAAFSARLTVETSTPDADAAGNVGRFTNAITDFLFTSASVALVRSVTGGDVVVTDGFPDRVDYRIALSGPELVRELSLRFSDGDGTMVTSTQFPGGFTLDGSGADSASLRLAVGYDQAALTEIRGRITYFSQAEPPAPPPPPSTIPEPTWLTLLGGALAARRITRHRPTSA